MTPLSSEFEDRAREILRVVACRACNGTGLEREHQEEDDKMISGKIQRSYSCAYCGHVFYEQIYDVTVGPIPTHGTAFVFCDACGEGGGIYVKEKFTEGDE